MKRSIFTIIFILFAIINANAETKIKPIYEGNVDAKIHIIVYESLTCGHCANFHVKVYPDLKREFIDKGILKIEFRNFPLDIAALNASKIAHCKNDGDSDILHFLYKNQKKWVKGTTVKEINDHLKNFIDNQNLSLDYNKCINNEFIENHILEDRIEGVKKFNINSTPTLIINNKKFEKALNYKNLKKTLEKLI